MCNIVNPKSKEIVRAIFTLARTEIRITERCLSTIAVGAAFLSDERALLAHKPERPDR